MGQLATCNIFKCPLSNSRCCPQGLCNILIIWITPFLSVNVLGTFWELFSQNIFSRKKKFPKSSLTDRKARKCASSTFLQSVVQALEFPFLHVYIHQKGDGQNLLKGSCFGGRLEDRAMRIELFRLVVALIEILLISNFEITFCSYYSMGAYLV